MKYVLRNEQHPVCPSCASPAIHRSRRNGLVDFFLHSLFFMSPYRCEDCDLRHLRFRHTHSSHKSAQTRVA
jgi:hypothetical protein